MKNFKFVFLKIFLIFMLFAVSCEIDDPAVDYESIEGEWVCSEQHDDTGNQSYIVRITNVTSNGSEIKIRNIMNLNALETDDFYMRAYVNGLKISIPLQSVESHSVKGTGEISNNHKTITLDFKDYLYDTLGCDVSITMNKKE